MKTKILVSTILGCCLLAFNHSAQAANGSGSGTNVENYNAQFVLVATPDAPPGARGKAEVESHSEDGVTTGKLSLQTQGLNAGTYNVTAGTTGGPVTLGQITIEEPSHGRGKIKSESQVDLPPDLEASTITDLAVSDGGTVLLTGDLTGTSKSRSNFNAIVPLIAGEAAPDATGIARLKSTTKKGKTKNNFLLNANGLPPGTTYTVEVDGAAAGTVTSNRGGHVIVKKLPAEITTINTVRLVDDGGLEAVRAEF